MRNHLQRLRRARGLGAAELARQVGVSRQTIYAVEAGSFVPNTEVALRLARTLEVRVEELFSLEADAAAEPETVPSELLAAQPAPKGQAVRVCQVGGRRVSIPVDAMPYYLPEADAVLARAGKPGGRVEIHPFTPDDGEGKRLVLAGCDPAIGLLARMTEKISGVEVIAAAASSKLAIEWVQRGLVHIAGSHLFDPGTGDYNRPYLRREFPGEDFAVVSFAEWEEGLVVAPGNPKGIRAAADLARRGVRFANREPGSGSRALLDRMLAAAGVESTKVTGYDRVAHGHLAVAYTVRAGDADCCIATRPAARAFALDFVPIETERYDFVMHRATLSLPSVRAFLDVLQRAALRRKLEALAGYDTANTGVVLA